MLCPLVYKKIVSSKNRIQKNFGPKRSRVKNLGPKIFGYRYILKVLETKKFWINNFFGPIKF